MIPRWLDILIMTMYWYSVMSLFSIKNIYYKFIRMVLLYFYKFINNFINVFHIHIYIYIIFYGLITLLSYVFNFLTCELLQQTWDPYSAILYSIY